MGNNIILNRSFLCCFSDGKILENMIKYINKILEIRGELVCQRKMMIFLKKRSCGQK